MIIEFLLGFTIVGTILVASYYKGEYERLLDILKEENERSDRLGRRNIDLALENARVKHGSMELNQTLQAKDLYIEELKNEVDELKGENQSLKQEILEYMQIFGLKDKPAVDVTITATNGSDGIYDHNPEPPLVQGNIGIGYMPKMTVNIVKEDGSVIGEDLDCNYDLKPGEKCPGCDWVEDLVGTSINDGIDSLLNKVESKIKKKKKNKKSVKKKKKAVKSKKKPTKGKSK